MEVALVGHIKKLDNSKRLERVGSRCSGCKERIMGAIHVKNFLTRDGAVESVICGHVLPDWYAVYNPFI